MPAGCAFLNVAVIQMCSINCKSANLVKAKQMCTKALDESKEKLDLICFPECSAFVGTSGAESISAAETIQAEGGYISHLCGIATANCVWISVGGFPELVVASESSKSSSSRVYNTHILINTEGAVVYPVYRKIHLFNSPLANLFESKTTEAGSSLVVHDVIAKKSSWRVGLTVCYDLRFPALYEKLCERPRTQQEQGAEEEATTKMEEESSQLWGAELVLVHAAFTCHTGEVHWEVLLRARAIENQCFIVAAAQVGKHNDKRQSYGHSMVVDPWGSVVARLGSQEEGICYACLDLQRLRDVRKQMPIASHRRNEL